jgi:hypothetical protein
MRGLTIMARLNSRFLSQFRVSLVVDERDYRGHAQSLQPSQPPEFPTVVAAFYQVVACSGCRLGAEQLKAITNAAVQGLKLALRHSTSKTVNNVLTVLNERMKTAAEWDVLDRMPWTIRLQPVVSVVSRRR